jgi:metal-dependent hydrolase (beta-lactamase superfamily II)
VTDWDAIEKISQLASFLPMHCSGQNFIDLAKQEMPEKLVLCTTGSRYTFTV